jgi:hypothetical protein
MKQKRQKGGRTFLFPGQPPVTPNAGESNCLASCCGYEGHECRKLIEPTTGVLQPRRPECFQKHIEQVRAKQGKKIFRNNLQNSLERVWYW